MIYGLRIRESADRDIDEIGDFIARDSLEAALRFFDAIENAMRELQHTPLRWPVYELPDARLSGIRKRHIDGFPKHLVFYGVDADIVEILRVLHGARDIPQVLSDDEGAAT